MTRTRSQRPEATSRDRPKDLTAKERQGWALDSLAARLRPYVKAGMSTVQPTATWVALYEAEETHWRNRAFRLSLAFVARPRLETVQLLGSGTVMVDLACSSSMMCVESRHETPPRDLVKVSRMEFRHGVREDSDDQHGCASRMGEQLSQCRLYCSRAMIRAVRPSRRARESGPAPGSLSLRDKLTRDAGHLWVAARVRALLAPQGSGCQCQPNEQVEIDCWFWSLRRFNRSPSTLKTSWSNGAKHLPNPLYGRWHNLQSPTLTQSARRPSARSCRFTRRLIVISGRPSPGITEPLITPKGLEPSNRT